MGIRLSGVALLGLLSVVIVGVIVASRDLSVGIDSSVYAQLYMDAQIPGFESYTEIGFISFVNLLGAIGLSYQWMFFVVGFAVSSGMLFQSLSVNGMSYKILIVSLICILISSWHITFATNALRQGVGLAIFFVSLHWSRFSPWKRLAGISLASSMHYSILLAFPALLLLRLSLRILWILVCVFSLGYATGANEIIIKAISDIFKLGAYEYIKFYTLSTNDGESMYEGFSWLFVIYTLFWPAALSWCISSNHDKKSGELYLLKVYLVMTLPYFLLGFGPFANRYAFFSWFMVPAMQAAIIIRLKLPGAILVFGLFASLLFFLIYHMELYRWM